MSRYAEITTVERRIDEDGAHVVDITCDPGGGATVVAEHVAAPGDDSLPLPGDFAALSDIDGQGREQAVGYSTPDVTGVAAPGEVRRYSRNAAGIPVAEIYLRKDGAIQINALASNQPIVIHATGTVQLISDSNDIRLGQGGRKIACVGDIVVGSMAAIATALETPVVPTPVTAANAVPVIGKIVSGLPNASGG